MDLARTETAPRSSRLADTLVGHLREAGLRLHRVPRRAAAFSVLRSPDVPSALIELGYLSSARDRERLRDPAWRARMAEAITAALTDWAVADAAEAALLRQ
jgi:N-acetylmuramoyl-L-alanine amidase